MLLHCPECRGPVSTDAKACPKCGKRLRQPKKEAGLLPGIVILPFPSLIIAAIVTDPLKTKGAGFRFFVFA